MATRVVRSRGISVCALERARAKGAAGRRWVTRCRRRKLGVKLGEAPRAGAAAEALLAPARGWPGPRGVDRAPARVAAPSRRPRGAGRTDAGCRDKLFTSTSSLGWSPASRVLLAAGSRARLGWVESHVPDPLEDQLCEECQSSAVTVILSSGQALCTACAAIRFRIPTTDRAKLRAAIETRTSAGAHWPRNS
jgi:hypothetical protein